MIVSSLQYQKVVSNSIHRHQSGPYLVLSHFKFGLLSGLPPLRLIQNASAWFVFNLPTFSQTTPLLHFLHWLPVAAFTRLNTDPCLQSRTRPEPTHLKSLITSRPAPLSLWSSSTPWLVLPSLSVEGSLSALLVVFPLNRVCRLMVYLVCDLVSQYRSIHW